MPVPHVLQELHGRVRGAVGLPARLFWSGPDPWAVRWDLADPDRRRDRRLLCIVPINSEFSTGNNGSTKLHSKRQRRPLRDPATRDDVGT